MLDSLLIFLVGTGGIVFAGNRVVRLADEFADRTRLGEALTGALLLGAVTSLPGLTASVVAAVNDLPEMAVSNALGGIAAQTVFLVVADALHKPANLEHTAASAANLVQGATLIFLLCLPLMAAGTSLWADWRVHPISFVMPAFYLFGLAASRRAPMWHPEQTAETIEDHPDPLQRSEGTLAALVLRFCFYGLVTAVAGWAVAHAGIDLVRVAGWSQSVVGGLLTAVASSLPELITSIAAVRAGAYTLAVSGIVGGNAFDTLFVAASDIGYAGGSIYHAMTDRQHFQTASALAMTGILLMGLIRRQKHGPGNVGFEGIALVMLYGATVWSLFLD